MAFARESPLVATVAEVTALTAVSGLANLNADDLVLVDVLAEANREVYDRLGRLGWDQAALSNQTVLRRWIAYVFLRTLANAGHMLVAGETATDSVARFERSIREQSDAIRLEIADKPEGASPLFGVPISLNDDDESFFH